MVSDLNSMGIWKGCHGLKGGKIYSSELFTEMQVNSECCPFFS